MELSNAIKGMQILAKYAKDERCLCAEHDILYVGGDASEPGVSEQDRAELDRLGWFVNEDSGSWACFT